MRKGWGRMSDLSVKADGIEGRRTEANAEQRRADGQMGAQKPDRLIMAAKIFFFIFAFIAALELAVYKFLKPLTASPSLHIAGLKTYTEKEIREILHPMERLSWFDFNVDSAASVLESMAAIDYVSVRKIFPDKIVIEIKEREPIAMTFVTENGRSVAVQIDENGVLFPQRISAQGGGGSLPILSGLPLDHFTEGMRIPSKYRALVEQISDIRKSRLKYFAAISEICVIPKEYGNYELELIPSVTKVRVRTDRALSEAALKDMMIALDILKVTDTDGIELDLRYGSVSYRRR